MQITGIRDMYRNYSSNFEATIMKLTEKIDHLVLNLLMLSNKSLGVAVMTM